MLVWSSSHLTVPFRPEDVKGWSSWDVNEVPQLEVVIGSLKSGLVCCGLPRGSATLDKGLQQCK